MRLRRACVNGVVGAKTAESLFGSSKDGKTPQLPRTNKASAACGNPLSGLRFENTQMFIANLELVLFWQLIGSVQ